MMLLSQHVETRHSVSLVASGGFGYLLKDRVLKVDDFLDAVRRVADGGSALAPDVVGALLTPGSRHAPLGALTDREHAVLSLVAQGWTDWSIRLRFRQLLAAAADAAGVRPDLGPRPAPRGRRGGAARRP